MSAFQATYESLISGKYFNNYDNLVLSSSPVSAVFSPSMPLEKGNSEVFRQREARAARLANEIEGSLQYRRRVSLENDEGRSEEDKFSSVVREREDRSSPGFTSTNRYQEGQTLLKSCLDYK